jgi:hypothetical protein
MTGVERLLQLPHAAAMSVGGMQAYLDDMGRMRAILDTTPAPFSWWTAVLLLLSVVAWLTMLTAGWIYLNRRLRRPSASSSRSRTPADWPNRVGAAPL